MKNSNYSHKYSKRWYQAFAEEDTRYYGVFLSGREGTVSVEPRRYQDTLGMPDEMKKVMEKRKGPLFHPAKKAELDYNVNFALHEFFKVKCDWNKIQKPLINRFLSEIKGTDCHLTDDDLFHSGIVDASEAAQNAQILTHLSHESAAYERNNLRDTLYSQFFHQLASQINAILFQILTRDGYDDDQFNRNVLYTYTAGKISENVKTFDGFAEYEKMCVIWNFIKHNTHSTFNAFNESFPDLLKENNYTQGHFAWFLIKWTDDLLDTILDGLERFFKEYCRLVFGEDAIEASWNYEEYFLFRVNEEIAEIQDPMGLRFGFY
jgi:hypothetical protein